MRIYFLILACLGLCDSGIAQSSFLYANAKHCDTCISTLLISHHEGTEYKDFYVDSGTVFIPQGILDGFKAKTDSGFAVGKGKNRFVPKKLNTSDFYFINKSDVEKLWVVAKKDYPWDFSKKYKIQGYVRNLKGYSLYFELVRFQQVFKIRKVE